jgi:hypothetical protein
MNPQEMEFSWNESAIELGQEILPIFRQHEQTFSKAYLADFLAWFQKQIRTFEFFVLNS